MSSEWWSILAVFWGLYLADGLRGGRRSRLYFHHWRGSRTARARVAQSSWFLIPPAPGGWAIVTEDLPASLAPEGLTNWPSGSASRPPPLPDHVVAFRWEKIEKVEDRMGWIFINGQRFAPASPALSAPALNLLVRELAPLGVAERSERLQAWHSARFASASFARRLRSSLARGRCLAFLNTLQTTLLLALTAYVILDGPARVRPAISEALADGLPAFLAACAVLHVVAIVWFYRLHRRTHPKAGQERASLLFTALFVPPQALRLRLHLTAKLAAGLHPLAVALACARPSAVRELATATVRDLRWPRLPDNLPLHVATLVRASSALLEPVVLAALARHDPALSAEALLQPPARVAPDACAFCPRCGDEFTRADSRCPHGIALSRF